MQVVTDLYGTYDERTNTVNRRSVLGNKQSSDLTRSLNAEIPSIEEQESTLTPPHNAPEPLHALAIHAIASYQ